MKATLEDEGHAGGSAESERLVLELVGRFLLADIGTGFDPRTATNTLSVFG